MFLYGGSLDFDMDLRPRGEIKFPHCYPDSGCISIIHPKIQKLKPDSGLMPHARRAPLAAPRLRQAGSNHEKFPLAPSLYFLRTKRRIDSWIKYFQHGLMSLWWTASVPLPAVFVRPKKKIIKTAIER